MDTGWQTIPYLNDFVAILEGGLNIDVDKYELFFDYVCNQLGLSININKKARGILAEFLGIKLNTVRMEARLPPDKLFKGKEWVACILDKRTITRQDFRSLLGFLSFACKVVALGQAFLRRLFTALAQNKQFYTIDSDMRGDFQWWHKFLSK